MHVMNILLTLFARFVRESICLCFFHTDLAPSLLDLYKTSDKYTFPGQTSHSVNKHLIFSES